MHYKMDVIIDIHKTTLNVTGSVKTQHKNVGLV